VPVRFVAAVAPIPAAAASVALVIAAATVAVTADSAPEADFVAQRLDDSAHQTTVEAKGPVVGGPAAMDNLHPQKENSLTQQPPAEAPHDGK